MSAYLDNWLKPLFSDTVSHNATGNITIICQRLCHTHKQTHTRTHIYIYIYNNNQIRIGNCLVEGRSRSYQVFHPFMIIYIYISLYVTACVAQLAKASDTCEVGHEFTPFPPQ